MAVSKEKVGSMLSRFALLFPPHKEASNDPESVVEVWAALMTSIENEEFSQASLHLARTLKRFPFPSDIFEEVAAIRIAAQPEEVAHG